MTPVSLENKAALFIVFGITGDLAQRYILPALHTLTTAGDLPDHFKIIGVSRRSVTTSDVYAKLPQYTSQAFNQETSDLLMSHTEMRQMDLDEAADYKELLSDISELEDKMNVPVQRLYYLSVPPDAFLPMIRHMGEAGHAQKLENEEDAPRLMVEKPFGRDLASAHELLDTTGRYFSEEQTYRIDHYVAKRMVQDIVQLRFNNPQFTKIWQTAEISKVAVVAHEQLDIEGRADFYEQTGALRDLLQSHLMQVLALTIMQPPISDGSEAQHAVRLQALQALRPVADMERAAQRAQYSGYKDEVANQKSLTETFAKLNLQSSDLQYRSAELIIESGKALPERLAYVELTFASKTMFAGHELSKLRFRIQPDAAVIGIVSDSANGNIEIMIVPDMQNDGIRYDGYARVVYDALNGDHTTFSTAEEIIRSWEIVQPVLDAWQSDTVPLSSYPKGSLPSL